MATEETVATDVSDILTEFSGESPAPQQPTDVSDILTEFSAPTEQPSSDVSDILGEFSQPAPQVQAETTDVSDILTEFKPEQPVDANEQFRASIGLDRADPTKLSPLSRPPNREKQQTVAEVTQQPDRAEDVSFHERVLRDIGPAPKGMVTTAIEHPSGAISRPLARLGTQFFVKPIRGLLQVQNLSGELLSAGAKKMGISNRFTDHLDAVTAKLQEPTTIERELDEDFQERLQSSLSEGKIGKAAHQIISEGGLDMATGLLQMMMLGSGISGKGGVGGKSLIAPGLAGTKKAIFANALIRGVYSFLTTTGTAKEKAKSGLITTAFMSTPAVAKGFKLAGLADLTANSMLSTMTGAYPQAWETAKQQAEASGNPDDAAGLFVANALPIFMSDLIGSSGTRFKGATAKSDARMVSKLPPEERAEAQKFIGDVDASTKAVVSKPLEVAEKAPVSERVEAVEGARVDEVVPLDTKVVAEPSARVEQRVIEPAKSTAEIAAEEVQRRTERLSDIEQPLEGATVKQSIEETTGVSRVTPEVVTDVARQLRDQFLIAQKSSKAGAVSGRKQVREKVRITRETNKAIRDLKRFEKLTGPKSKTIPQEFKEQINAMLEGIGLKGRARGDKAAALEATAESQRQFIERMQEQGEIIPIPSDKIIDLSEKNVRDMTLEDLQSLRDQVKTIAKVGRDSKIQLGKKGRVTNELLVRKAVKAISKFGKTAPEGALKFSPPSARKKGFIQKSKDKIDGVFAPLRKNEFITDFLGKDVHDATTKRIQDAGGAELRMQEQQKSALKEAISPWQKGKAWRNFTKNREKIAGTSLEMTREEAVTIALNAGNKGNLRHLVEGNKLPEAAIDRVVASLSAKERVLVNKLQKLADASWEQSADVAETITGVRPQKIEGKYWPVINDRQLAKQAATREAEQDLFQQVIGKSFVGGKFTKARTGGTDAVDLKGTSALLQHLSSVAHFNTHAIPVRDVNKIIRDPRFKKAVSDTYNEAIYESAFPKWLKSVANPRQDVTNIDRTVNAIRRNSITANLALKVSVSAMQAGSFSQTVHELGKTSANSASNPKEGMKWSMKGMADFYGSGNPMKTIAEVNKLSTEMRNRASSVDRDMNEATSAEGMKRLLDGKLGARDLMFGTIRMVDAAVTYPTWMGAYAKEMSQSGDQSKAIDFADKTVRKTQPQGAIKDLAEISKGGAFQKLFTQYYSFFSVAYNQMAQTKDFAKLSQEGKGAKVQEIASALTFLLVVPALYSEWARKGFRLLTKEEMAGAIGGYAAGTVPFLRDVASPYGIQAVPAATGTKKLKAGIGAAIEGFKEGEILNEKAIEGVVRGTGQLTGLPTEQAWITANGLIDLMTGETDNLKRLGFSEFSLREPDEGKSTTTTRTPRPTRGKR